MGIFLGIPTRGQVVDGVLQASHRHGCEDLTGIRLVSNSLLTLCFNALWCEALNDRPNTTEFAMLHSDVHPVEEGWLRTLRDERRQTGCDILSAVVPIKDERGISSTAFMDPETGVIRRLTMKEARKLPATFDADAAGFPGQVILPNTGLWICDFAQGWVEEFCFSMADRIVKVDGQWKPQCLGEDWGLGVWAAKRGLKVMATTKIKLFHHGDFAFPDTAWGSWETDKEVRRAFKPLRQLHGALAR